MGKKKKQINITGPRQDLDRLIEQYLNRYELHLENAVNKFSKLPRIRPLLEGDPYRELLNRAEVFLGNLADKNTDESSVCEEEAFSILQDYLKQAEQLAAKELELEEEKAGLSRELHRIEPYRRLDCSLQRLRDFQHIRVRFGRIPLEYYQKFFLYVYDSMEAVFYECERDEKYAFGIYFVPVAAEDRAEALFSTVRFERLTFSEEYTGTPEEVYQQLQKKCLQIAEKMEVLREQREALLTEHREKLCCAYKSLRRQADYYKIKKQAACINEEENQQVYYILSGWMTDQDARGFFKEIEQEENIYCFAKDI